MSKKIYLLSRDKFEEVEIIKETEKTYTLEKNKAFVTRLEKKDINKKIRNDVFAGFDKKELIEIAINSEQERINKLLANIQVCKNSISKLNEISQNLK